MPRGSGRVSAGNIVFVRKQLSEGIGPAWQDQDHELIPLDMRCAGESIADFEGLKADFANKFIGGGVLSGGGTQEETMFCCFPELMCSMLFCEQMLDHEAIEIHGISQYLTADPGPRNMKTRRLKEESTIVAFDALSYNGRPGMHQYRRDHIERELNKCYIAVRIPENAHGRRNALPFVTGNWGGGAFRGDIQLKSVIQLMAASAAGVPKIIYCPFDNEEVRKLGDVAKELRAHGVTVGMLWTALTSEDYEYTQNTFEFLQSSFAGASRSNGHFPRSSLSNSLPLQGQISATIDPLPSSVETRKRKLESDPS